jgi:hypothetical protein
MGRLTAALRQSRADAGTCDRVSIAPRAAARSAAIHDVSISARYAGRSCCLRPMFDRSRQWAAQRAPRVTPAIYK